MSFKTIATLCLLVAVVASPRVYGAQAKPAAASASIPKGAKVFVASMPDGFDDYLKKALAGKKVPVEVVASRDGADFEITGTSETHKASTAKKAITLGWHSDEEASVQMSNLKSGEVAWAYSVHKQNSAHGKRSTAEAIAKHLKEAIQE